MPTYVVLINFTDQGIRNVKQTTERTDHGGEIAQKHGLKLEQAYWTVGPYDMVAVFEAPDDAAMSAHRGFASQEVPEVNHLFRLRGQREVGHLRSYTHAVRSEAHNSVS
jgi:GYD domain